jgi:hypothetical protein
VIARWVAIIGALSALFAACEVTGAKQGLQPPIAQSLSARIPTNIKRAILDSLEASDRPTPDDKQGGFHEEGGMWVTTTNGEIVAEPTVSGEYAKPGDPARLQINEPTNAVSSERIAAVDGMWHVHPGGEIVNRRVLPARQEGNKKIITTITTTSYFTQPPSEEDITEAEMPINIVVGARSRLVYFYNRSGIIGTMPLEEFLAPLQLPPAPLAAPDRLSGLPGPTAKGKTTARSPS